MNFQTYTKVSLEHKLVLNNYPHNYHTFSSVDKNFTVLIEFEYYAAFQFDLLSGYIP